MSTRTRQLLAFLLITILLSACTAQPTPEKVQTAAVSSTPRQTPSQTAMPVPTQLPSTSVGLVRIAVTIGRSTSSAPELDAGTAVELRLDFEPSVVQIFYNAGKEMGTTTTPWKDHPVREMQACLTLNKPCELTGRWEPLKEYISLPVNLDWIGQRTYYFTATFRDANGTVVNSVHSGYTYDKAKGITKYENIITSRVNTLTPIAQQPPFVRTAVAATQKAFPVTGSVTIAGGNAIVGGVAGSKVNLKVQYYAASPLGKVTQMRTQTVTSCKSPQLTAAWEPFTPEKTYSATLALNFVGFYVAGQFKDEKGNLSPVYCDDITLEGSPQRTP